MEEIYTGNTRIVPRFRVWWREGKYVHRSRIVNLQRVVPFLVMTVLISNRLWVADVGGSISS